MKRRKVLSLMGLAIASGSLAIACSSPTSTNTASSPSASPAASPASPAADADALVVYSGRSESLIGELLQKFETETGTKIQVRYGDTAELAAALLEEGDNSPADVFFAQDAGALGAIQKAGKFTQLPDSVLNKVAATYRSPQGTWVGVSGRVRTVDYNVDLVPEAELPQSIFDLTDPKWKGKVGWAPTNGSFQAFVTAMRISEGEDRTREWLEGMKANEAKVYPKNVPIVEALGRGEISLGLVNHYYLDRAKKENPSLPVMHHFTNDVGSLVNVAGVGILKTADQVDAAQELINFLLSEEAQTYFAQETEEYPLVEGIALGEGTKPLSEIQTPDVDLSNLDDLEGTLQLLQETGVI